MALVRGSNHLDAQDHGSVSWDQSGPSPGKATRTLTPSDPSLKMPKRSPMSKLCRFATTKRPVKEPCCAEKSPAKRRDLPPTTFPHEQPRDQAFAAATAPAHDFPQVTWTKTPRDKSPSLSTFQTSAAAHPLPPTLQPRQPSGQGSGRGKREYGLAWGSAQCGCIGNREQCF